MDHGLFLSQLQRYHRYYRQEDADDPETGYDLGFMKAFLLVMVVQRRHQEDPAALAKSFPGVFKPAYLHYY